MSMKRAQILKTMHTDYSQSALWMCALIPHTNYIKKFIQILFPQQPLNLLLQNNFKHVLSHATRLHAAGQHSSAYHHECVSLELDWKTFPTKLVDSRVKNINWVSFHSVLFCLFILGWEIFETPVSWVAKNQDHQVIFENDTKSFEFFSLC